MDKKYLQMITSQVLRKFPEMQGCTPHIETQTSVSAKSLASESTYIITYQGTAKTPNGKSMPRRVRVIADGGGNIIRISTTR